MLDAKKYKQNKKKKRSTFTRLVIFEAVIFLLRLEHDPTSWLQTQIDCTKNCTFSPCISNTDGWRQLHFDTSKIITILVKFLLCEFMRLSTLLNPNPPISPVISLESWIKHSYLLSQFHLTCSFWNV